MAVVNMDGVEEPTGAGPVPPGKYLVDIVEVVEKQSDKGTEYWSLQFKIVDGEYEGRNIWDNVFWSEKSLPRLKLILKVFEMQHTGEVDLDNVRPFLAGKRLQLSVKHEKGQDGVARAKPEFNGYLPASDYVAGEPKLDPGIPF